MTVPIVTFTMREALSLTLKMEAAAREDADEVTGKGRVLRGYGDDSIQAELREESVGERTGARVSVVAMTPWLFQETSCLLTE